MGAYVRQGSGHVCSGICCCDRRGSCLYVFRLHFTPQKRGVHNVHTLPGGLGRITAGLARIGDVSAGAQCSQGPESGSSPTSGTISHVRGVFCF